MSFRHSLYIMNNDEIDTIRPLTKEELYELKDSKVEKDGGDNYLPFDDIYDRMEKVFEFGTIQDDMSSTLEDFSQHPFSHESMKDKHVDYDLQVFGKEGLIHIIRCYEKKIQAWYKTLLKDDGIDGFDARSVKLEIEGKIRQFDNCVDTDLDNKYTLSKSYYFEHSIFTLVHILKTVNWEKESILIFGS